MTLRQKQSKFSKMVVRLLLQAEKWGYEYTFGECKRSVEEAARLAALGVGVKNSIHCLQLAIDINLFKDGLYLGKTTDHQRLGEWWETIGGTWGGRFKDGNHYSLEHNGVK